MIKMYETLEYSLSAEYKQEISACVLQSNKNPSNVTINRRCTGVFSTAPKVCVLSWYLLDGLSPNDAEPNYLLWAISFLRL